MRGWVVLVGIVLVVVVAGVGIAVLAGRDDSSSSAAEAVAPDDPRLAEAVRDVPVTDADAAAVRGMLTGEARPLLVQHAETRRFVTEAPSQPVCSTSVDRLDSAAAPPRMAELAGGLPDGVLPDAFAAERVQLTDLLSACLQGKPAGVPNELRSAVAAVDVRLDQLGVPR